MNAPKNPAAENRRQQLRTWIATNFAGVQAAFIASTNDGEKQINQGELSGLLDKKSFGEKRARSLERQAGMPVGYLDLNPDHYSHRAQSPARGENNAQSPATGWPFTRVTLARVIALKKGLGGHKGAEAINDIDETLDLAVLKWEHRLAKQKSAAA